MKTRKHIYTFREHLPSSGESTKEILGKKQGNEKKKKKGIFFASQLRRY